MDRIEALIKLSEFAATAALALVAAYSGAKFAFQLEETRIQKQTDEAQVKQINRLLFELSRTYNHFLAIRRQFIDEYRNGPDGYITMPAMSDTSWLVPTFDFEQMAFLLKSSDPNLMGELSMLQEEASTTDLLIKQRSDVHINQVQPALEGLFLQFGERVPVNAIRGVLGTRMTAILENTSRQLVESVDHMLELVPTLIARVRAQARPMFPGHPLLKFTEPESELKRDRPMSPQ